jgi:EmrB/QacA subfamily drug resistance transporter
MLVVVRPMATRDSRAPIGGIALGLVLAAQFVVVLDFSIVNVALPALSRELGVSADTAQWVVTAYALTFGGLLVLGGRAADFFGRRRVLTVGLVGFAVASAAGGLAADMALLVAARAVQGIAGAMIAPAALSILTTSFSEGPRRNRVLGLYGIMASVGFVAGLVAGGVLVDTVGWRGVFFVNVPVCLTMAVAGRRLLPEMRPAVRPRHLDLAGGLLVTAAAAMLVLAPSVAASDGWASAQFAGCLVGGGVLLAAFVRHERRSPQPLVPLGIFRQRVLVAGDIVVGLAGAWVAAEVLVLSLYSQDVLKYSALVAGLAAVPQGVGGVLRGVVGPRLLDRVGVRTFLVGNCALAAASLAVLFRFPATSRYPLLGVVLIVLGFGTTNVIFGTTVAGSAGVRDDQQGLAGAVLNASRQIGAAIGTAVLLSVAAGTVTGAASAGGYRTGMLVATGAAVVAALVSLYAKPRSEMSSAGSEQRRQMAPAGATRPRIHSSAAPRSTSPLSLAEGLGGVPPAGTRLRHVRKAQPNG